MKQILDLAAQVRSLVPQPINCPNKNNLFCGTQASLSNRSLLDKSKGIVSSCHTACFFPGRNGLVRIILISRARSDQESSVFYLGICLVLSKNPLY